MRLSSPVRGALSGTLLLLCLVLTPYRAHAADESTFTFRESVHEVRIAFAATDGRGQAIRSLRSSDVAVTDNGWVIRNFRSFRPASEMPLDVVFLLDISASVESELPATIAELARFLEGPAWSERDRASLLVFGGARPQQLCLHNCRAADVREKLNRLHSEGQTPLQAEILTPLYDALLQAAEVLQADRNPEMRPAIVLISDGRDTISRGSMADALRAAEDLEASVYAINSRSRKSAPGGGDFVLAQLAAGTGGLSFAPGEEPQKVFRTMMDDLRSGYVLTYRSPRQTSGPHSVRLLPAGDPTLRFRSRQSYEQE